MPGYSTLRSGLLTVQRTLAELEASATSDDGLITATVSGRGTLIGLELDERIYRATNSRALAADIAETIRAAATSAADKAFTMTTRALEEQ